MSALQRYPTLLAALWQLALHQLRGEYWIRLRRTELWGQSLSAEQSSRCRHYFRGALFLGALFAAQRGRALNRREMRQFARLAALAALFDDTAEVGLDLADNSLETALEIARHPSPLAATRTVPAPLRTFAQKTAPGRTLLFFWKKIYAHLPAEIGAFFEKTLLKVFELETQTTLHGPASPSIEALQTLAEHKGGYSALLFRLLLQPQPSPAECRAARALGALVQASDDLFDLWHDAQRHISTPARYWAETVRLDLAEQHFKQRWHRLVQAINTVPGTSVHARRTALALAGLLVTLTCFCLQHYRHLMQKHGTLPWHQRKAMVLDMARWSTRLRAIAFALKNGFLPK
jgi:hypothetical protein